MRDFKLFLNFRFAYLCKTIFSNKPVINVYTDASNLGYGGYV